MNSEGKGLHLTLDCLECSREKLSDFNLVVEALNELPQKIGMQKLTPPYVINYSGNGIAENSGITGVVIVAESHISIHTYPEKKFFAADVYSCKSFDTETVVNYLKKKFDAKIVQTNKIKRGPNYVKILLQEQV